jgi:hypothetical protein
VLSIRPWQHVHVHVHVMMAGVRGEEMVLLQGWAVGWAVGCWLIEIKGVIVWA